MLKIKKNIVSPTPLYYERGGVDIIFVKILSYTVQPRTGGSISVMLIENIPSES